MWEHAGKRVPVHSDLQLPEGRPISGKAKARRKKALASSQIFGKDRNCHIAYPSRLCRTPARPQGGLLCFLGAGFSVSRRVAGEFVIPK
jgi:hypothetical protein